MSIEELKMLAAASLLSGSVRQLAFTMDKPSKDEIKLAVEVAGQIWEEIEKQAKR